MRLSQFEKKYKSTIDGKKDTNLKPKVIFAPDVAKFKMELFGKKANNMVDVPDLVDNQKKGFNDVLPHKKDSPINGMSLDIIWWNLRYYDPIFINILDCSDDTFKSMGNRLLDWFSVLMGQPNYKKSTQSKGFSSGPWCRRVLYVTVLFGIFAVSFSSSCAKEVAWMFGYLDSDQDAQLSMAELYALEHNEREHCLKPFIDQCDDNR